MLELQKSFTFRDYWGVFRRAPVSLGRSPRRGLGVGVGLIVLTSGSSPMSSRMSEAEREPVMYPIGGRDLGYGVGTLFLMSLAARSLRWLLGTS